MAYTRQQLENMSIEELRKIDRSLNEKTPNNRITRKPPIKPGDLVYDNDPG